MACGLKADLSICQGKTFLKVFQWAAEPVVFRPITALAVVPSASMTVVNHGIPDGWHVAVVAAPWAKTLNARNEPPSPDEYFPIKVIDANTIEFNGVNSAGWKFSGGGYVRFYSPVPLSGCAARMTIKDRIGGDTLLHLDTENGRIRLDDSAAQISLSIPADLTASIDWLRGVYDLEIVSPSGVVSQLAYGRIAVTQEVTT